jgi:glycosyltransferase involved in cell wall biosynthesis
MLPKEVCFIAGTLGQGGAERQLFHILKSLQQSGVGVRVLSLTKGEFWEKRIRELRIPVTWVGEQESKMLRLASILKALRGHRPQVLQSQHVFTNLYAVAAARALGIREVGALRNSGETEAWSSGKVLGRLNLRAPRSLVVNSRAAMRKAIDWGVPSENLHFLPNVVDSDQFKPAGRLESDRLQLIAVARLVKEKRLDRFLDVLARLQQRSDKPVSGLIVGAGPLKARLEDQARGLGLSPETFEIREPVQDMRPIYHQADILVLTSDFEGTPNVVLEAMASGLPVVATRVGGVPEVVRDGETGYLTEPGDDKSMTDALLALIKHEHLRSEQGSRARKYIESNYSVDRLPALLEGLYSEALS